MLVVDTQIARAVAAPKCWAWPTKKAWRASQPLPPLGESLPGFGATPWYGVFAPGLAGRLGIGNASMGGRGGDPQPPITMAAAGARHCRNGGLPPPHSCAIVPTSGRTAIAASSPCQRRGRSRGPSPRRRRGWPGGGDSAEERTRQPARTAARIALARDVGYFSACAEVHNSIAARMHDLTPLLGRLSSATTSRDCRRGGVARLNFLNQLC